MNQSQIIPPIGRVAFVHGRPGPHPFHAALAKSVAADFVYVDFKLRHHDRATSAGYRLVSALTCALLFPQRSDYQFFIAEGAHVPPLLMKRLGLLRKSQKVLALLADETLYFLKEHRFPKSTEQRIIRRLSLFDGLICVGEFQCELANELLENCPKVPQIVEARSAVLESRAKLVGEVEPQVDGQRIIFIGHGPNAVRGWYKGLDLMLYCFEHVREEFPNASLVVVGEWDEGYLAELRREVSFDGVQLTGYSDNISNVLQTASLCVHLARGEAFGISILEAMLAGVPTIVSNVTGAREAVRKVDDALVAPLSAELAAERVCWYFRQSLETKQLLSNASRQVAREYSEEAAIVTFSQALGAFA